MRAILECSEQSEVLQVLLFNIDDAGLGADFVNA